jgi:predicted nuclease with TOPRIM domain
MGDARPMLASVKDALVVAESVVAQLHQTPSDSDLAVNHERLDAISEHLTSLTASTDKLTRLLREPSSVNDNEIDDQASRVEAELARLIELANDFRERVTGIHSRAAELKSDVERDLFLGAIGVTVLLFWFGLSQVSLFMHARAWLKAPIREQPTVRRQAM